MPSNPPPYGPPAGTPPPYPPGMPAPRPTMPTGLLVAIILAVASIVASSGIVAYVLVTSPTPLIGGTPPTSVTVSGYVLAGAGESVPVGNAVVTMGSSAAGPTQVITDASGFYQLTGLPGATYRFSATLGIHWGSATGPTSVVTLPTTSPSAHLDLVVPASDITGTVTSAATGAPLAGATMSIADPSGNWWCCQYTGSDGRYLLWTISAGMYNVSAAAGGLATAYALVSVPSMYATEAHDFPLPAAPAVATIPAPSAELGRTAWVPTPPFSAAASPAELTLFKVAS